MRVRSFAIAMALQFVLAGCGNAQSVGLSPGDRLIAAPFDAAVEAAQRSDYRSVYLSLQVAMEPETYRGLSPERRYLVAQMYGVAANAVGDKQAAHKALVLATSSENASSTDWYRRFETAVWISDGQDAMAAFRHLTKHEDAFLTGMGGMLIGQFDQLIGQLPDATQARSEFARQLIREDWTSSYPHDDLSVVWLHGAQALLATGDLGQARVAATHITSPSIISAMLADPRLDRLTTTNPKLQDAYAAAEDYLQWSRAFSRERPRLLGARVAQIVALSTLNRHEEALAVAEEATLLVAGASATARPFDDMYDTPSLAKWRDSTLVGLGRVDEAIGSRTTLARDSWGALRLASTLLEAGRARDAVKWLQVVRPADLGLNDQMTFAGLRACAAAETGDAAGLADNLAILRRGERQGPEALVKALICADQNDAAASTLSHQLNDEQMRLSALVMMQTYAQDRFPTALDRKLAPRWSKLRSNPELIAQTQKVGRIRAYDIVFWGPTP